MTERLSHIFLQRYDEECHCGSGAALGECCGRNDPCPCGSGRRAGECCYSWEEEEGERDGLDNGWQVPLAPYEQEPRFYSRW